MAGLGVSGSSEDFSRVSTAIWTGTSPITPSTDRNPPTSQQRRQTVTVDCFQASNYTDFLAEVTAQRYRIVFRLLAAGFALAALYHLAALAIPAFGRIAYPPTYPTLRHITFVIVDSMAAFLFLLRPGWFIWPYLVLTVQVLRGHGVRGWRTWVQKHQVNWIDAITVFGALLGLALLVLDRAAGKHGESTSEPGPAKLS